MSTELCWNELTQVRSTAPAFLIDAATARASSGSPPFISMMMRALAMLREHLVEPRHADALASKWMPAVERELEARIDAREFRGRQRADGSGSIRRPVECRVVNDDGNAVGGEMDVDLEAVGAERHAVVDRRHGVFRRELRAATMGEDERTIGFEDWRAAELTATD